MAAAVNRSVIPVRQNHPIRYTMTDSDDVNEQVKNCADGTLRYRNADSASQEYTSQTSPMN